MTVERRHRNVPDPSATIPDFGPRPNVRVDAQKATVNRLPTGDVAVERSRTPRSAPIHDPAPPGSTNALLLGVIGILVAIIAGGLGFFAVVFAGLLFWMILG